MAVDDESKTPESFLARLSRWATEWSGSSAAIGLALATIVIWLLSGPYFNYSDTWQLIINTGTTVVTFLMVFLIQRAQNKDSLAIHLKLNEIVAALHGASNRLIEAERFSEKDLETLQKHYKELAQLAREEEDVTESHSVEEARERHSTKHDQGKRRAS